MKPPRILKNSLIVAIIIFGAISSLEFYGFIPHRIATCYTILFTFFVVGLFFTIFTNPELIMKERKIGTNSSIRKSPAYENNANDSNIKTDAIKDTVDNKRLPKQFKEMNLALHIPKKNLSIFENQVLRKLLMSYQIYYYKAFWAIKDTDGYIVYLFCRPEQEASIAYNLGIYCQTMFDYQSKETIQESKHILPEDFIKQISVNKHLKLKK